MGTKRAANHGRLSGSRMVAAVGAVMMLLAVGAVGCGGGNSGTLPVAGVWVANSGTPRVQHYPGTDFVFNGSFAFPPVPVLNSAFVSPQDTLFDANNNLWVVDGGNAARGRGQAIYRFLFNQVISLNTTPNPPPNFVITTGPASPVQFVFPQFAAFDTAGDLWVSDSGANAIFEFSTAQLSTGAGFSGTPAAVLTNPAPPLAQVFRGSLGIAFDPNGTLWVANNAFTTIIELSAAQLKAAAGVTVATADKVLNQALVVGGLPTINNPWGILFDANGNMWFTNEQISIGACSGSVVEFTAAAIAGGNLTPAANVAITQTAVGGTASLCDPNGITMNKNGNIVVANAVGNSLAEYTASQITNSGNLTPHTLITGAATLLNAPTGLTYGPLTLR